MGMRMGTQLKRGRGKESKGIEQNCLWRLCAVADKYKR